MTTFTKEEKKFIKSKVDLIDKRTAKFRQKGYTFNPNRYNVSTETGEFYPWHEKNNVACLIGSLTYGRPIGVSLSGQKRVQKEAERLNISLEECNDLEMGFCNLPVETSAIFYEIGRKLKIRMEKRGIYSTY